MKQRSLMRLSPMAVNSRLNGLHQDLDAAQRGFLRLDRQVRGRFQQRGRDERAGCPASNEGNRASRRQPDHLDPIHLSACRRAYRADFKLRNAEGVLFSFRDPSQTFWVEIQVVTGKVDLVAMACSIRWSNASEDLPCPGLPTDARGFAYTDFAPLLENGTQDDEPAIWLGVQQIQDGCCASLPVLLVPENARFSTVLAARRSKILQRDLVSVTSRERPSG